MYKKQYNERNDIMYNDEILELIVESYEAGNISLEEASVLMEAVEDDKELAKKVDEALAKKEEEKRVKRNKVLKTLGKGVLAAGALGVTGVAAYGKGHHDGYNAASSDEFDEGF